jgi:Sulfotransferase family
MRILVVGPARSGTSWVTATLGTTPGAAFLSEPDHPGHSAFALRASVGMGSAPVLGPDDAGPRHLRRLWDAAFGAPVRYVRGQQRVAAWLQSDVGEDERSRMMRVDDPEVSTRLRLGGALAVPRHLPPDTRHRVVKSVRAHYRVEWIVANWQPAVVVCRRHPLDVVASRMEMAQRVPIGHVTPELRNEARHRCGVEIPAANDDVAVLAWRVGVQMSALYELLGAHPQFHVVDHEAMCADPIGRFRALADALGLDWSAENEAVLVASNRPGTGYELNRVQADLPGAWRRRLSPADARTAAAVIAQLPIAEHYDLDVSRAS